MTLVVSWLFGALAVVGMFLLLIGPHEAGHFGFAKLFRVNVLEFSLGMGTRLWSTTRSGTLYAFRLLPIGGYVRLGGMEPGDYETPNGFHSKAAWQRILVLLAGPGVNFLVAALIATGLGVSQLNSIPGLVNQVNVPSPAYNAGIRPGDQIVSVSGHSPRSSQEIISAVASVAPGQALTVVVRHPNGGVVTVPVTPEYDPTLKRSLMGVSIEAIHTPTDALVAGVTFPYHTTIGIAGGIYQLASGEIPGGLLGPSGATGPVGIAALTAHAANQGFEYWLYLLAILSVALGLANLLPLPALDGGRIVVVLVEKLRGRAFDREREMQFQRFGLVALLALTAVIAYIDIQRLINHQFPGIK
ncbi:MAG: M50 family metallopeptidase [Candidatus Dormibacteraeota bacterium]|nr:M50 family metallopeptidase [Candidatus Dormibacteraeota bacterium]